MAKKEETIVDVREVKNKTEHFIEKNRSILMTLLVIVLVGILGFVAYNNFVVKPKTAEAAQSIWFAENALLNDSLDLAINGDGLNLGLEDVANDYAGTVHGERANYLLGIAYRNKGMYDEALSYFQEADLGEDNLAAINEGNIGDMMVELSNVSGALPHFEKAASMTDNGEIKSVYLMKAALASKDVGDNAKAAKHLSKIVDDLEDASNYRDAVKLLASLPSK